MVFRHDAGVTDAAFNPERDRIVTSSFDRTARIWNVEDGSEIAVLKGHQDALERAMFSPDGPHCYRRSRRHRANLERWVGKGDFRSRSAGRGSHGNVQSRRQACADRIAAERSPSGMPNRRKSRDRAEARRHQRPVLTVEPSRRVKDEPHRSYLEHRRWDADQELAPSTWQKTSHSARTEAAACKFMVCNFGDISRLWDVSSGTEIATPRRPQSDTHGGHVQSRRSALLRPSPSMAPPALGWRLRANCGEVLGEETAGMIVTTTLECGARSGRQLRVQS